MLPAFKELLKDRDNTIIIRTLENLDVSLKNLMNGEIILKKQEDITEEKLEEFNSQVNSILFFFLSFHHWFEIN